MTLLQQIKKEVKEYVEYNTHSKMGFPSHLRKRPVGCPNKNRMIDELQELSEEELFIAFRIGIIGNSNKKGTLIENCMDNSKPYERTTTYISL
nr:hypothetical protein [uncultured Carboxylicivirga sp.]